MEILCALEEIINSTDCKKRAGIRAMYWTDKDNIDWAAMLADNTKFDATNQQILGYIMNTGKTFNKVTFNRESAFFDSTFTEDTDVYTHLAQFIFDGLNNARLLSLKKAAKCCNVYMHLYLNNGLQVCMGIDYDGLTVEDPLKKLTVTRHLMSSGQLGSSKARDEMDIGGTSFEAPITATVTATDIPVPS